MKNKMLSLTVILFFVGTLTALAGNITDKVKVNGNCGLCKTRIQNAALSVDGVSAANWGQETKVLQVTYDNTKTDIQKIQMAIARAGHDTQDHKAPDAAYNKLPKCCQYNRVPLDKIK